MRKKKRAVGKRKAAVTLDAVDLAVGCAKAALEAAMRSDKTDGWFGRVGKGSNALLDALGRAATMSARKSEKGLERLRLAVEERRLALLEAREKRQQEEYEATHRKREHHQITQVDIDGIRWRVFGLGPDPNPVPAVHLETAAAGGAGQQPEVASRAPGKVQPAAQAGESESGQAASHGLPMVPTKAAPVLVASEKRGEASRFPGECELGDLGGYL